MVFSFQKKDKNRQSPIANRLWVVTELYYPEETSTGYYLTRIAEGLTEDFEVKVLCGQPNYSAKGVKAPKREIHKNVEIFRSFGTTFNKNVIIFRLLNMVALSLSTFFRALVNFKQGDLILVVTNPPSLPFIAAIASLLRGASYVLLIHDNYPEILVAAKKTKENSFFVKTLNYFNRWLFKYTSKIIVCGRDMFELIGKKTAGLDIPIETIPNWAELETVKPAPRINNSLLKELGITEKLVFLYAGNMGYPNDIESIIECAEILKDDERFCFVFLGTGVKRQWLAREVENKCLKNVKLLAPRPRSEQNIFLNACDVAIVTLVKKMWGVSMPSRTYNILAAGKPILAMTEENSEIARVVEEDNVGWTVVPGNPEKLLQKILEINDAKNLFVDLGKNARQAALKKYSLEKAIEKYRVSLK
ncbi:MAG: glycosyltransferase family 4 protein [Actinomycetota bacterium]